MSESVVVTRLRVYCGYAPDPEGFRAWCLRHARGRLGQNLIEVGAQAHCKISDRAELARAELAHLHERLGL